MHLASAPEVCEDWKGQFWKLNGCWRFPLVTRVVVDESVSRQLDALDDPVDVCDRDGRVLGRFLPMRQSFTPLPSDECPYTPDELRAMQRETGGRSLSEIWESLGGP